MYRKIVWLLSAVLLTAFISACSSGQMLAPTPQQLTPKQNQAPVEQSDKPLASIPVLMYHSIADEKGNDAVISAALFAKHMEYLYQQGYYTASLDELYDHLTGKKALPEKSVVLTFDDGYLDTYATVMPILKSYGFRSTVFVPAADIGKNLTVAQLKEMKQAGMVIASHSNHHRDLSPLTKNEQLEEVLESKTKLDKLLNQDTKYFCYPNGSYNDVTLQIVRENGFKMAFTINPGWVQPKDDLLLLKRVWMGNSITLPHLKERLSTENYPIL